VEVIGTSEEGHPIKAERKKGGCYDKPTSPNGIYYRQYITVESFDDRPTPEGVSMWFGNDGAKKYFAYGPYEPTYMIDFEERVFYPAWQIDLLEVNVTYDENGKQKAVTPKCGPGCQGGLT
jgi:hypothetical protein